MRRRADLLDRQQCRTHLQGVADDPLRLVRACDQPGGRITHIDVGLRTGEVQCGPHGAVHTGGVGVHGEQGDPVGAVGCDEQDIRKMGGLRKHMPFTAATFLMACLAIAGFPLFSGFFSKDLILWSALSNTHIFQIEAIASQPNFVRFLVEQAPALASGTAHDVMLAGKITAYGTFILSLITAFMTAFYMFRLYFLTFEGECRADEETKSHLHESPPSMVIPLVILGVLAVIGGLTGWPHFIAHVFEESSPSISHFMLFFEHWFDEVFRVSNEFRITNRFGSHAAGYEAMVTALGSRSSRLHGHS